MADRVQWTGPSGHRGSLNILWTCISTLGLCVWTAVHPNVRLDGSWLKSNLKRVGMMMVAIILPEVIICSAWQQLHTARHICEEISKMRCQRGSTPSTSHSRILTNLGDPEKSNRRKVSNSDLEAQKASNEQEFLWSQSIADSQGLKWRTYLRVRIISAWIDSLKLRFSRCLSISNDRGEPQLQNKQFRDDSSIASEATDGKFVNDDDSFDDDRSIKTPVNWSMDQAFFATMGGFIVNTPDLGSQYLTAEGVLTLGRVGLLPQLNEKDIQDRNKADALAKGLVIWQLTWFLLQVLARLVNGLPVTLLEAHASIHVGFTILIFALWFRKPYNVRYPVTIVDQDSIDVAQFFEFDARRRCVFALKYCEYEREREEYWKHRATSMEGNNQSHDPHPPPAPPILESLTVSLKQYTTEFKDVEIEKPEHRISTGRKEDIFTLVDGTRRAVKRLHQHGFTDEILNARRWDFLKSSCGYCQIQNTWGYWSSNEGHEMSVDKAMHMLFNILYGAGHMTAWSSTSFPTVVERWMWRGSAIMLCSVPIWGVLWILWWKAVSSVHRASLPFRNGDLYLLAAPLFLIVICAYAFARGFFLVECLVSLRSQPAGAYQNVPWTAGIPHVS